MPNIRVLGLVAVLSLLPFLGSGCSALGKDELKTKAEQGVVGNKVDPVEKQMFNRTPPSMTTDEFGGQGLYSIHPDLTKPLEDGPITVVPEKSGVDGAWGFIGPKSAKKKVPEKSSVLQEGK